MIQSSFLDKIFQNFVSIYFIHRTRSTVTTRWKTLIMTTTSQHSEKTGDLIPRSPFIPCPTICHYSKSTGKPTCLNNTLYHECCFMIESVIWLCSFANNVLEIQIQFLFDLHCLLNRQKKSLHMYKFYLQAFHSKLV